MITENKKLTAGKIIFTLICICMFPALLLFLSGDWLWVEGWIFSIWLIFKPTLSLPSGKPKGNVDAELVLHTIIEYSNFEKAIIVSGDGDFYCLIDHLKRQNKLLKVMIPNQYKYSSLLRNFNTDIVFMNNLREKLEHRRRQ